jgi:hypothetical protein
MSVTCHNYADVFLLLPLIKFDQSAWSSIVIMTYNINAHWNHNGNIEEFMW